MASSGFGVNVPDVIGDEEKNARGLSALGIPRWSVYHLIKRNKSA